MRVLTWRRARYNPKDSHLTEWHLLDGNGGGPVCGYWGRGMKRDRENFRSDNIMPQGRTCPKCEEAAS